MVCEEMELKGLRLSGAAEEAPERCREEMRWDCQERWREHLAQLVPPSGDVKYSAQEAKTPFLLSAWWSWGEHPAPGWSSLSPAVPGVVGTAVRAFVQIMQDYFMRVSLCCSPWQGKSKFSEVIEDGFAIGREWRWGVIVDWGALCILHNSS